MLVPSKPKNDNICGHQSRVTTTNQAFGHQSPSSSYRSLSDMLPCLLPSSLLYPGNNNKTSTRTRKPYLLATTSKEEVGSHSHRRSSTRTTTNILITLTVLCLLINYPVPSSGLSVGGVWSPRHDFVKVIAKFGFLKSDVHHKDRTDGYIFGNVTVISSSPFSIKTIHEPINDPPVINGKLINTTTSSGNHVNSTNTSNKTMSSSSTTTMPKPSTTTNLPSDYEPSASLILIDRSTFIKMIGNIEHLDGTNGGRNPLLTCDKIFDQMKINGLLMSKVYDKYSDKCDNVTSSTTTPGQRDLLRMIPCPASGNGDKMCPSVKPGLKSGHHVPGSQVTFVVENQKQPTFWYLLLVSCVRNSSCHWLPSPETNSSLVFRYRMNLVNGWPEKYSSDVFTYHFSYEQQDIILYLVMMTLYAVLTTLQLYAVAKQRNRNLLVFLFTISMVMHTLSFFFSTIHKLVYAHNGVGYKNLSIISDVLRILSLGLFILFVLIIAKGWPITRAEITAKPLLVIAWLLYVIIELILFIWTKQSLDIIRDIDEYHTVSGWFSLLFRIFLMLWFLCELRTTMMLEQNQMRLRFYLHFGAGIMVWFVHLPIVAIIGLQISIMWRYKLILGFSSAANFLAFSIVTNFMWPSKMSYHFLTHPFDPNNDNFSDELEDYDREASEHFNYYNNPNYTQPNNTINGGNSSIDNGSSSTTSSTRRHNNHRSFSHPFGDPNHLKS